MNFKRDALSLALASLVSLASASNGAAQQRTSDEEIIIVTGSSTPIEPAKLGSSVSVITADDMEAQGIVYASDALRHVPGIAVNRTGSFGALTQVRMRGSEGNHVKVMIDGIDASQGGNGEFDFSSLLAAGVERIEVLRGPQSGLYGSNALAGVINVITRNGAAGTAIDLSAEAGSYDTSALTFGARGGSDQANGAITVGYRESFFDSSPTGVEDDGDESATLLARGQFAVSDVLTLRGSFRVLDKQTDTDDQDFSGGPLQGTVIDADNTSYTDDRHLSMGATWNVNDGRLITRIDGALYHGDNTSYSGGFASFGSKQTRDELTVSSTYAFGKQGSGVAHLLTGFVQNEDETYTNLLPFDPSQAVELDRGMLGIGVEYRAEVNDRLFVSGTVRADDNEGFEDETTSRLTLAYFLNDQQRTRFHSSWGKGVTNPTFFEQFGFIPGTFIGNPDLTPEFSDGWDAGIEQRFGDGRHSLDVTYFNADLKDEIDGFGTPFNNVGISRRSGVELSYRGGLSDNLSVNGSYTYTNAENSDASVEVRRPEHIGSVDLVYRTDNGRGRFHVGAIYSGDQVNLSFVTFAPTELDGYTLVNIGGSYQITERVELYARVDNLFDEQYEDLLGFATPGLGVLGGFRWRLATGL